MEELEASRHAAAVTVSCNVPIKRWPSGSAAENAHLDQEDNEEN